MIRTYQVLVCGQEISRHTRKAEALAAADNADRAAAEELGEEPIGDGAASVYDLARGEWVPRTR
jgi:hypothetical protein